MHDYKIIHRRGGEREKFRIVTEESRAWFGMASALLESRSLRSDDQSGMRDVAAVAEIHPSRMIHIICRGE